MVMAVRSSAPAEFERFFRLTNCHLLHTVRANVGGVSDATIEDACQAAWTALVRREVPVGDERRAFAYLARVAIRRGWRLAGREARFVALSESIPGDGDPADWIVDRETLGLLGVSRRQRRMLWLQASGLSYVEICGVTGDTPRTVARQLSRGRKELERP